jgi:hypothetical protein
MTQKTEELCDAERHASNEQTGSYTVEQKCLLDMVWDSKHGVFNRPTT